MTDQRLANDDAEIHRPALYGEGQVEARHAAALARARSERGARPGPGRPPSGTEIEAHGDWLLARRQAKREEGLLPLADPDGLERRLAEQQGRRNAAHALVPIIERFEDYLLAQLGDVEEVTEWAADAAAGTDRWLVLLGPVGVGKTWQAVAAYRAVTHDRGQEGLAITVAELLMRSLPSAPDRINLRAYERADVLLLDDLTAELSDWDRRVLFQLIDARSASNRLTIITSNVPREEIRPALGERLASRLSQRVRLVLLTGPDHRLSSHT
jgi:DNA replication protein DnaC